MFLKYLAAAGLYAALAAASPTSSTHALHERKVAPRSWMKRAELDRNAILPMRIALAQRNMDKGADWLYEVSHPDSSKYGEHWSAEEIAKAFSPSVETLESVKAWLVSSGIDEERIKFTQSKGWLRFDASTDEAERLLQTKYHVYEHDGTGQPHVACEEYSIPSHLKSHIDFITPTVHFDAKVQPREDPSSLEARAVNPGAAKSVGNPNSASLPKLSDWIGQNQIIKELENCDQQITPNCLRALYKFPPGTTANPANSFGIVEYTPQAYVPSDMDMFFRNFSPKEVGQRPILDSIDGGFVQTNYTGFEFNGESDLDLQYGMTLVYPQQVTLYQVGDLIEGASFNNFLDAIDASYCSYEGGDDYYYDGQYPDEYCSAGTFGCYQGLQNCGGFSATKVISTSYAYDEHDLTPFYEQRQCNEYLKLGMMRVAVIYSAGDDGVAGGGGCINGDGPDAPYESSKLGGRFNPSFPSTCPWVTSVGATQVINGTNILTTKTQPEEACARVIFSGGGFSNVFPLPSYQASAVQGFFKNHPPPYSASQYNNSMMTRGFPDVSANGARYVVAVDGKWALVYGTSASAPTFGSILTLINEARYNIGKSSVGFINPVAYAHPYVFSDITQGTNPGCATTGFSATTGWDPVTGLGVPNYPAMLALWLLLK